MPDPDKSRGTSQASGGARAADSAERAVNAIEIGPAPSTTSSTDPGGRKSRKKREASAPASTAKAADNGPQSKPSSSPLRPNRVPDSVAERFIQIGNNFFFPDGAEAFTDHGNRITTRSENTVVIQSMVAIAEARGTGQVTVHGTDFFKREAWFAAQLAGLVVQGYDPTALEQERLVRAVGRRRGGVKEESTATSTTQKSEKEGELITGRLVDHGAARYHHKPNQPMSYFVRIETERGEREIWGVDLERAFLHSLSRPGVGDEVGLRAVGRESVTVPEVKRDAEGREVGRQELKTHRNQWILERRDFLDRRREMASVLRDTSVSASEAVKRYPELEGSYLAVQVAGVGADERLSNPELREQFVNHLRAHLARTVEYGQPLQPVPLRTREDKTQAPDKVRDRDHAPTH